MIRLTNIQDVLDEINKTSDVMTYEQISDIADNYNRLIPAELGHVFLSKQYDDRYELHVFVNEKNYIDITDQETFDKIHDYVCNHHIFMEGQCEICGAILDNSQEYIYGSIPSTVIDVYDLMQ